LCHYEIVVEIVEKRNLLRNVLKRVTNIWGGTYPLNSANYPLRIKLFFFVLMCESFSAEVKIYLFYFSFTNLNFLPNINYSSCQMVSSQLRILILLITNINGVYCFFTFILYYPSTYHRKDITLMKFESNYIRYWHQSQSNTLKR